MGANLTEYLEYLCSENDEINDLIIVNDEGLPIAHATSAQASDQTLVSGMCTALNCIGRELIREMLEIKLERLLVECSEGVVLIQPLNQKGILVASCSDMEVISKIDISIIQRYFISQQNHLVAM
ncbi:MAG: roadblock/LC7 domain-containing protein [Candidatus Hermodarchaeota archaeon]